jgi:hypothetical protein
VDEVPTNGVAGTPWTEDEVSAAVESYSRMLAWERAGSPYNKSENRRRLMEVVHRSEGSIERKLQNVSAVLDVLGVHGCRFSAQIFLSSHSLRKSFANWAIIGPGMGRG